MVAVAGFYDMGLLRESRVRGGVHVPAITSAGVWPWSLILLIIYALEHRSLIAAARTLPVAMSAATTSCREILSAGRPQGLPSALTLAIPAATLSLISADSSSAAAAKTCNVNRPVAVVVSIASWRRDLKPIP